MCERDKWMNNMKWRYQNIGDFGNVCAQLNVCVHVNNFVLCREMCRNVTAFDEINSQMCCDNGFDSVCLIGFVIYYLK